MNETQNQPQKTTHPVNIFWGKDKAGRPMYIVDPPLIEVIPGDKVEFYSKDAQARISFPDSGIIDNKGCWETIEKGDKIEKTVMTSDKNKYYYAVMCKHDDGKYWYAEGNTCPAMNVGP